MPHDLNGKELKVGDEVMVLAKVVELQTGTDFCNVTIESVHGRKPDAMKERMCLNTAVLVRCPDVGEEPVYIGGVAVVGE